MGGLRVFIFSANTLKATLKIFPRAFHGYSLRILLLAMLGFFAGLLEGIGITALIPIFNFFNGAGRQPTDFISNTIEKFFMFIHIPFTFPVVLFFIVFLFFLKFIATILYTYIATRIQMGYERDTMNKLFELTLKADWPYLLKQKLGRLETLIKIDSRNSGGMLNAISSLLMILTALLAYFLIAINISKTVTIFALMFGGLALFLYKPIFSYARTLSQRISYMNNTIAHHINESIIGIKTIKVFGVENPIISLGKQFFEHIQSLQLRSIVLARITTESMQPFGIIFIMIIVSFAFYQTSYNLGTLAALVYLINRIFQYTQQVQGAMHNISSTLPYVENVTSYIEEAKKAEEDRYTSEENLFEFNKQLKFKSVSFSYTDRKETLSDISFVVRKGEIVGFIGPSGAGKTTVFDLLLRLLRPTNGEISIDDKNIYSVKMEDWRRNIAYVSQDVFILNDTVFNNIKFFDKSITREDAEKAAKMAYIYDFIHTLPNKFDTIVGEHGNLLSAGQRQRIALARALARKPKILLLDEATSSLDNESEQQINNAIENLKGSVTILVIAHRLSTVRNTDKLFVLDEGKIVEEGNPHELLKDKDTYFYKTYDLRK